MIADEVDADGSARLTARVVTSAGRRGSEALVLTTEAGATGTPGFRAAADGDHVVVVYSDADGLWLQRFAFTRQ